MLNDKCKKLERMRIDALQKYKIIYYDITYHHTSSNICKALLVFRQQTLLHSGKRLIIKVGEVSKHSNLISIATFKIIISGKYVSNSFLKCSNINCINILSLLKNILNCRID